MKGLIFDPDGGTRGKVKDQSQDFSPGIAHISFFFFFYFACKCWIDKLAISLAIIYHAFHNSAYNLCKFVFEESADTSI